MHYMRFQPMHATVCPRHPSYVTRIGSYSRLLVEQENAGSALEEGVCGGETGETATDDDDLSHLWDVVDDEEGGGGV